MSAPLDFDRLVREYLDNLNVNLRGFRAADGVDFLESWVPSDDPTDGLLDLVDLARDAGLPGLAVSVGPDTAARLDLGRLDAAGPVDRSEADGRTVFAFALGGDEELSVHPCYRAGLRGVLRAVSHETELPPQDGRELFAATRDGVTLAALVDARGTVARAGFLGAADPVRRGLLEALCRAIEAKPLQEAADHGPLAVEHALRDPSEPPPVPGLVTPDNADPAFALPVALVRALRDEYARRTGAAGTANFYDRPVSDRWRRLPPEQRADEVRAALAAGGLGGQLEVVGLDGPKRVVVRFSDAAPADRHQELLVRCEEVVRRAVEPGLHAVAQAKADKNVLRVNEKKRPGGPA